MSRFRSTAEPASTSIYETIRQHDETSGESDLEERAGLMFGEQNNGVAFGESETGDASQVHSPGNLKAGDEAGKSRAVSPRHTKPSGKRKRRHGRRYLVDVEEGDDDDVPASLLIEGTEGLLPHEIGNLPPLPEQTTPDDKQDQRARLQWAQTQAAHRLHPIEQTRSTTQQAVTKPSINPLAMADPKEKAMWRWNNVQNLDNFLYDVYDYYLNNGFWSIILLRAINLLTVAFILGFFLFLTQCVNYRKIRGSTQLPEILVPRCTKNMGVFPNLLLWFTTFFWIYKIFQYVIDFRRLIHLHEFYHHLLGVTEEEIQSISWQEIVSRLMALRDSNPNITTSTSDKTRKFLGTQNKQRMDAHDIANRLMRKENYMVAMINKDILDMTLPIPGLRNKQLFTRTLEWNINQSIMQFVFNKRGQIRQLFLKDTHRRALSDELRRRFIFAGTMNLIIAPFLIGYFVLENFFRNFNEYQKNPAQIGIRRYNVLAEWKFREFNELWHLFERRLNMSQPFATRYINQFPKEKTVHAARFVALISGAIVSILGVATILDQENFLSFEITPGRTTIFYLGVFGGIWAIARGLLPDDNMVYDSSFSMEAVIEFTHFRPAHWEGRLHTVEVKTEFARLYQMQISIFIEEVLSMVFTPFVLWFSLPKCSDQIIDFFREFTVHVDGVGYVCSFAEFNFKKPGNTIPSSNNTRAKGQNIEVREDYFATKDQKLEQSYWGFMNDYARNPKTDVQFPYREANNNRRHFNNPPPFPSFPSPQLQASSNDFQNASPFATGRQTQPLSPRKKIGFQASNSRYAGQVSGSPLQSVLLDPHHLPPPGKRGAPLSPEALRPRQDSAHPSSSTTPNMKGKQVSKGYKSMQRETIDNGVIAEDPDNPPDDLLNPNLSDKAGGSSPSQNPLQRHNQHQQNQRHHQPSPHQDVPPMSSATLNHEELGSWNKPGEEADEYDSEDQEEEDVKAVTGEATGVLGLIRQFQRAQRDGARTAGTGMQ